MSAAEKPCGPCPWTSKDPRDQAAIAAPDITAAMQAGQWFACHGRGGGTCIGAQLRHAHYLRQCEQEANAPAPVAPAEELTPIGVQLVIPGCERRPTPAGSKQGSLW